MGDNENSQSGDPQHKPMKGKYDGRRNNGKKRTAMKRGPKPKWMKHLSRNAASKLLQEFDNIVPFPEIYKYCWEHGKVELMVGMREYVWNRLEGRPFIAENPVKVLPKQPDPRIQEAIDRLLPKPTPRNETAKPPVM